MYTELTLRFLGFEDCDERGLSLNDKSYILKIDELL